MKNKLNILFPILLLSLPITGCDSLEGFTSLFGDYEANVSENISSSEENTDNNEQECSHDWVIGITHVPTCTQTGNTEYICSKCGDVKQDDEVPALGHNYGEWTEVTAATCLEVGEEQRVCTRDSSHVETREIPSLGHSYVDGICERCGAVDETHESEVEKYYKPYNLELQGNNLATELQKMSFDKHTNWISYGQVNAYFSRTSTRNSVEAIEDGSSINQWFYTGK